jgi:hypothetical protein
MSNLELFLEFYDAFPKIAEEISTKFEAKLLPQENYQKLSEENKYIYLLETIFDNKGISAKLAAAVKINRFLNNNFLEIINNQIEQLIEYDFENKEFEINGIIRAYAQISDNVSTISLNIKEKIRYLEKIISNFDFSEYPGFFVLPDKINKLREQIFELENKVASKFKDIRNLFLIKQKEIIDLNSKTEKNNFSAKVVSTKDLLNDIIAQQDKIILKIEQFSNSSELLFSENIEIIDKLSPYLFNYNLLLNYHYAINKKAELNDQNKLFLDLEKSFFNAYHNFFIKNQEILENDLNVIIASNKSQDFNLSLNKKDLNFLIKNKVIEPLKQKCDDKAYELINKIIDLIY